MNDDYETVNERITTVADGPETVNERLTIGGPGPEGQDDTAHEKLNGESVYEPGVPGQEDVAIDETGQPATVAESA